MHSLGARALVLLLAWQVVLAPAAAETIVISGLGFPVDAVTPVGDREVAVRLGGKETVVASAERDNFIVRESLASSAGAGRFDVRALLRFFESALDSGELVRAGLALRGVRRHPAAHDAELVESFTPIAEERGGSDQFLGGVKSALAPVEAPEVLPRFTALLVFAVGLRDVEWVQLHCPSLLYSLRGELRSLGQEEAAEALRLREIERAERVVSFLRAAFGEDDPFVRESILRIERVRSLAKAAAAGNVDALGEAMVLDPPDRELGKLLAAIALEGLHKAAGEALEAQRPDDALRILARVEPLKRTETTHQLVLAALTKTAPSANSAVQRPDVANFLDILAANDEGVKREYGGLLTAEILFLVQAGAVSETEPLLARLVSLQPEEAGRNDEIRAAQARGYLERGALSLAERKVSEIQSKPLRALWLRTRIAVAGMSLPMFGGVLSVLIAALCALLLSARRGSAAAVRQPDRSAADAPVGERDGNQGGGAPVDDIEAEDEHPRGFVVNELRRMSPAMQEYQRCLEMLGLSANADVRAIKHAYRQAVKSVHPDRNRTNDEATSARFIELTKTYDRILELRKEFGYED